MSPLYVLSELLLLADVPKSGLAALLSLSVLPPDTTRLGDASRPLVDDERDPPLRLPYTLFE